MKPTDAGGKRRRALLCCVLCFALLAAPVSASAVISPQSLTVNGEPVACEAYNIDGCNYFRLRDLAYVLNGTTYGIGAYYRAGYTDLCPATQVWTPASGTLTLSNYSFATIVYPQTGEELTITEAVTRSKPEYLVITLGVNGVSFMDEDWFIRDYTALVQNIQTASPDTKIILNSIYPVAVSYQYQSSINNQKINAANGWIEQIAADTGCRFLYSFEAVVGADGYLPESSQNGDGLHLNGGAFCTVMQYIRTHAYF